MKYTTIGQGQNSIKVSRICLGTMTWGEQNTEREAHEQMNYAFDQGVNFFDVAEMYPVPSRKETATRTESYIGNWLQGNQKRAELVLATKVAGPSAMDYLRPNPDLDPKGIQIAIEGSLRRLQTDYIDLYQLHWPSRQTNYFGQLNYKPSDNMGVLLEDTLGEMEKLVQAGKVRHIGVSNETPWGVMHALAIAERNNWQKIITIQNPYNVLNRSYEVGLAEVSYREKVLLLVYSPMAFGVLSGKYYFGTEEKNSRLVLFREKFGRYLSPKANMAVKDFVEIAKEFNYSPASLALAFVNHQAFVGSNIIGATTMEQLKENINSINIELNEEQLQIIEEFSEKHSNPCP